MTLETLTSDLLARDRHGLLQPPRRCILTRAIMPTVTSFASGRSHLAATSDRALCAEAWPVALQLLVVVEVSAATGCLNN